MGTCGHFILVSGTTDWLRFHGRHVTHCQREVASGDVEESLFTFDIPQFFVCKSCVIRSYSPSRRWRFDESEQAICKTFIDRELSRLLFRRLGWINVVSEMTTSHCQEVGDTVSACRKVSPWCSHSGIVSTSVFATNSDCPYVPLGSWATSY